MGAGGCRQENGGRRIWWVGSEGLGEGKAELCSLKGLALGVEAEAGGEGGEGGEGLEAEVELGVGGGGEAEFALVLVADVGALFDLAGAELEEVDDDLEGAEGFAIEGGGVESGLAREFGLGEEPVAPVVAFGVGDGEGGLGLLGFGGG
jgi:hypothetical protein